MNTRAAQALQQVLVAATHNPDQRAHAVTALRGSEVYASTWPTEPGTLRTLLNSSGVRALALFTDMRQLEEAALRYGWLGADGQVPARRIHLSEAIRFARQSRVALVIVDIASDHALELDQGEMELVAAPPSTRPPSYEGLAKVTATPLHGAAEVKRASSRPPPANDNQARVSVGPLAPAAVNVDAVHHSVSARFAMATTSTMAALSFSPSDELIAALCQVLRDYCEVEWACLVADADRTTERTLGVALAISRDFRKHLPEISMNLRKAASEQGASIEVLVLDTNEQMKQARKLGQPFYPWRKR